MSNVEACPFCNLGERVVLENEHARLFLSNPRKVEGQVLVTPKRHIEKPWEIEKEELLAIFSLVWLAQARLSQAYGGGCDVKQNYRPFMKQGRVKVDHVHYHVYPRTNEDELYQLVEKHETDMFVDLSDDERNKVTSIFV